VPADNNSFTIYCSNIILLFAQNIKKELSIMPKSKGNVKDKIELNSNHLHDNAKEIRENFRKSTHHEESATLPGLGTKER
jgi:hypothetical protein